MVLDSKRRIESQVLSEFHLCEGVVPDVSFPVTSFRHLKFEENTEFHYFSKLALTAVLDASFT